MFATFQFNKLYFISYFAQTTNITPFSNRCVTEYINTIALLGNQVTLIFMCRNHVTHLATNFRDDSNGMWLKIFALITINIYIRNYHSYSVKIKVHFRLKTIHKTLQLMALQILLNRPLVLSFSILFQPSYLFRFSADNF